MEPNYYAVIPAAVRYDKDLTASAKLLYGEISALANSQGFCWATNGYFADLYGVTKTAVSGWIKQLEKRGHVRVEVIRNEKKEVTSRNIYIIENHVKNSDIPPENDLTTPPQKNESTPPQKNLKENNTSSNITSNNIYIVEIIEYLNEKLKLKRGFSPKTRATQRHISARLNEGFTVDDFKTVIDSRIAKWLNDEKMREYLRPSTLFGTKFEDYLQATQGSPKKLEYDEEAWL